MDKLDLLNIREDIKKQRRNLRSKRLIIIKYLEELSNIKNPIDPEFIKTKKKQFNNEIAFVNGQYVSLESELKNINGRIYRMKD